MEVLNAIQEIIATGGDAAMMFAAWLLWKHDRDIFLLKHKTGII